MSAEVAKLKKFQILNECHDRTGNMPWLILSKVIIGLELYQQNQRYGCFEDFLELWDAKITKKSKKLPDFAKMTNFKWQEVKKFSYWKVSSLLYIKCAWWCSQKHKIECLSSIICDFIGCWKWDKLQKVGNC